jgi:hypothetical protein
MKIDYKILFVSILVEVAYSIILFFIFLFTLWGIFGEGAGAETNTAIICGDIAIWLIISPPIIYNFYKMIKEYKQNFITFLVAQIIIITFFCLTFI